MNKERYEVKEVATQTQPVFIDNNNEGKQTDLYEVIAKIANDIETIKKALTK